MKLECLHILCTCTASVQVSDDAQEAKKSIIAQIGEFWKLKKI